MNGQDDNVLDFKVKPREEAIEAVVWDRQQAVPKPFWEWISQASRLEGQRQWVEQEARKPCGRYFGVVKTGHGLLALHAANSTAEITFGISDYVRNWWRSNEAHDDQAVPVISYPEWSHVKGR